MEKDKKEKGMLSKVFGGAAKLATIGVAAAVTWQILLDPIFFPIIHNLAAHPTAAAWVSFIQDHTAFITDFIGFTGDGGLLQSEWGDALLADYYPDPVSSGTTAVQQGTSVATAVPTPAPKMDATMFLPQPG
ncbi:MAG TPA: hypothetical protein PK513_00625 [Alphaproteobacteria bacterium]|nr:hypothetical protein [Alphaproteobacteria bacterium]USO05238.1 MAG: hypothetical protein H6859_08790 [Rhodospirillales bacterium]HOO80992.1 hypothetical protein [Alphaproteobacteria bacterium]